MLMFTLAISCLTTSNLPWFMDLTFQVPMKYCSLLHRTLLSPLSDTSKSEHHIHFGPGSSFLLELFLHFPPVAYGTPTDLGGSSSGVISFCLFILFMGFSREEYWFAIPFSSGPCVVGKFFFFFGQNSPPWPVHLWWPCTAQLIASFTQGVMGFLAQPYDLVGLTKPRSWWVVLNAVVHWGQMPHLPGSGSMLAVVLQKAWWYAFVHIPQVSVPFSTATFHIQNSILISQTL